MSGPGLTQNVSPPVKYTLVLRPVWCSVSPMETALIATLIIIGGYALILLLAWIADKL